MSDSTNASFEANRVEQFEALQLTEHEAVTNEFGRLAVAEAQLTPGPENDTGLHASEYRRAARARVRQAHRNGRKKGSSENTVGLYLDEIGQHPLLTAKEERELAQKIESGRDAATKLAGEERLSSHESAHLKRAVRHGDRAKEMFINCNLRLVVSIAKRYPVPDGMEFQDLIQEGNLGLQHAVEKFDWRKGFKFSTYGSLWVRQAIGRALDDKSRLIRVPGYRSASLRAALRATSSTGEELDPENADLQRLSTVASLDYTPDNETGADLHAVLASTDDLPEDIMLYQDRHEELNQVIGKLPVKQRDALVLRYGLKGGDFKNYNEVGQALGITREAARRLVGRAELILREQFRTTLEDL